VSQHADEEPDQDVLLEFSTEPVITPSAALDLAELGQPAADVEVAAPGPTATAGLERIEELNARVDRLEQTLDKSASQVASLKSALATLVSTIDDIKKINRRPASALPLPPSALASKPRRTAVSAVAGIVLGLALGVFGWTMWSRDSLDTLAAAPAAIPVQEPAAIPMQEPAATEVSPSPAIAPAVVTPPISTPAPARETRARAVPAKLQLSTPVAYVGTLSIDSAPGGEVFINRQAAGRTPLRVANLKAGSHLVWIERDGYRRWTQVVQVRSDHVNRVSASLEPLAAR